MWHRADHWCVRSATPTGRRPRCPEGRPGPRGRPATRAGATGSGGAPPLDRTPASRRAYVITGSSRRSPSVASRVGVISTTADRHDEHHPQQVSDRSHGRLADHDPADRDLPPRTGGWTLLTSKRLGSAPCVGASPMALPSRLVTPRSSVAFVSPCRWGVDCPPGSAELDAESGVLGPMDDPRPAVRQGARRARPSVPAPG
jgi:hypothetical protein